MSVGTFLRKIGGGHWSFSNGAAHTEPSKLANEVGPGETGEYGTGVDDSEYAIVTADSNVSTSQPARLFKITVVVATATAAIDVRNSTVAGAGDIIETIPAGTAKGTVFEFTGSRLRTGYL